MGDGQTLPRGMSQSEVERIAEEIRESEAEMKFRYED